MNHEHRFWSEGCSSSQQCGLALICVVFVTPCTKSPYLTFTLRRPDRWGRGVRSEGGGGERGCFREAEVQRDFGRSPLSLDPLLSCRNNKTI